MEVLFGRLLAVLSVLGRLCAPVGLSLLLLPVSALAQQAAAPQGAASAPEAQASEAAADASDTPTSNGNAFTIRVEAPADIRSMVTRFLDLKRYQKVPDLDNAELGRLMERSEIQIRQMLGTQGYFTPTITQKILAPAGAARPEVVITIEPGERTRIGQLDLRLDGAISSYPPAAQQVAQIRYDWALPVGEAFTQTAWSTSKVQALQALQAERFAAARLLTSQTTIDPDTNSAHVLAQYDSGPVYRYGPVQVQGAERYDAAIAQRLTQLPVGQDYRQSDLLQAQERLLNSGYYTGASVLIDTSAQSTPEAAPVLVNVQEARLQKLLLGVGFNTDSGPGVSFEHTHNRLLGLGWRALTKLKVNRDLQVFSSSLLSPPDESLWQWLVNGSYTREKFYDTVQTTQQARFGRTKNSGAIERTWYVQYDRSKADYGQANVRDAQALSANYVWTLRRFNSNTFPTGGYGVGMEAGGGITTYPQRAPFVRLAARYQGFVSLDGDVGASLRNALPVPAEVKAAVTGNTDNAPQATTTAQAVAQALVPRKNGELVFRLDAAGLRSRANTVIPPNLLFLTGGNATVRGYGYQQIGVDVNGITEAGRYMVAGSVEYRRPVFVKGRASDWDSVVFVDAGNVANTPAGLRKLKFGVGAGALWRSPVGPVQLALAYGVQERKVRLHMNLGFHF